MYLRTLFFAQVGKLFDEAQVGVMWMIIGAPLHICNSSSIAIITLALHYGPLDYSGPVFPISQLPSM